VLAPHCSAAEAKQHAQAFQEFEQFNSRVASLRTFGVDLVPLPSGGLSSLAGLMLCMLMACNAVQS